MVSPRYHAQTAWLYHSAFFFFWKVIAFTPINDVWVYKCVCDCKPWYIYFFPWGASSPHHFSIFLDCLSRSVLIAVLVLVIQLDSLTQAPLSWAGLAADTHVTKPNIWLWLTRTLSDFWHTFGVCHSSHCYCLAQTNIKERKQSTAKSYSSPFFPTNTYSLCQHRQTGLPKASHWRLVTNRLWLANPHFIKTV